jgi:hypothetical protein
MIYQGVEMQGYTREKEKLRIEKGDFSQVRSSFCLIGWLGGVE